MITTIMRKYNEGNTFRLSLYIAVVCSYLESPFRIRLLIYLLPGMLWLSGFLFRTVPFRYHSGKTENTIGYKKESKGNFEVTRDRWKNIWKEKGDA